MKFFLIIYFSFTIFNFALADVSDNKFQEGQKAFSEKDYKLAYKLWLKLANDNYIHAQSTLGFLYAKGLGVEQNDEESAKWIGKASNNGELQSMYNMAGLYVQGLGVSKDYKKAEQLYRKSISKGFKISISGLIALYRMGEIQQKNADERKYWESEDKKMENKDYINQLYSESVQQLPPNNKSK